MEAFPFADLVPDMRNLIFSLFDPSSLYFLFLTSKSYLAPVSRLYRGRDLLFLVATDIGTHGSPAQLAFLADNNPSLLPFLLPRAFQCACAANQIDFLTNFTYYGTFAEPSKTVTLVLVEQPWISCSLKATEFCYFVGTSGNLDFIDSTLEFLEKKYAHVRNILDSPFVDSILKREAILGVVAKAPLSTCETLFGRSETEALASDITAFGFGFELVKVCVKAKRFDLLKWVLFNSNIPGVGGTDLVWKIGDFIEQYNASDDTTLQIIHLFEETGHSNWINWAFASIVLHKRVHIKSVRHLVKKYNIFSDPLFHAYTRKAGTELVLYLLRINEWEIAKELVEAGATVANEDVVNFFRFVAHLPSRMARTKSSLHPNWAAYLTSLSNTPIAPPPPELVTASSTTTSQSFVSETPLKDDAHRQIPELDSTTRLRQIFLTEYFNFRKAGISLPEEFLSDVVIDLQIDPAILEIKPALESKQ